MKKLLLTFFIFSCIILFSQENHQHKKEIISLNHLDVLNNNPFKVDKKKWIQYYNQTNLLLENIDEDSFLNYVILKADGDFNDLPYFIYFINADLIKDMQTLIYKVGVNEINSSNITAYFTNLQPKWHNSFNEFEKNKDQIISQYKQFRGPGNNNPVTIYGCGSACTNPGFESGTSFWNYWTGDACTSTDPCGLTAGFSSSQHELTNAGGFDPIVSTLPVVAPGGGNHAMLIGDGPQTGAYASRASISFDVSASNTSFIYKYAVVLEDPVSGHSDPERPYFRVKIRDAAGNVVQCGDYEVIAKPPMNGFLSAGNNVWYRPWTTVVVPLTSYIGQCVTIEFTSSDCSQGAHYGYAYVDADCGALEISTSNGSCNSSGLLDTIFAPSGAASYVWTNTSAGGTTGIVGSATGSSIIVNQAGTYQVVMTSVTGPTCITTLNIVHTLNSGSRPKADFDVNPNPLMGYNPVANFIDKSSKGVVYWEWAFGDGTSHPNTITPNPVHEYPKIFDVNYTATLIVKSANGCADTVSKLVKVGPETSFFIPNAFTPNHDGLNDSFGGEGVGILKYELLIYDRWGNKIFTSDNINKKWNGKVKDGEEVAQMDVYAWRVILTDVFGEEKSYIGTVTLVR